MATVVVGQSGQGLALIDPNLPGFTAWVYSVMGVPRDVLPANSIYLQLAFDESINLAYVGLRAVPNRSPWRVQTPDEPPAPPVVNPSPPLPGNPIVLPPVQPRPVRSYSIYAIAVYNLGGAILCEIAIDDPDLPPPLNTYWQTLREKLGLNAFSYGMVTSASDQGTSAGQQIPSQIADMSLANLALMQTPWGRRYLSIAGQVGTLWGIS